MEGEAFWDGLEVKTIEAQFTRRFETREHRRGIPSGMFQYIIELERDTTAICW